MPKAIELTFELNLQKVSCPGVWLCQDGMVSLTMYALGSSYQTCMVPPIFPLVFKDVFYFRRRFEQTCTLSNIFCLLQDETIYCELVQWSGSCVGTSKCIVLAQYLGALNDVLFPPNVCSTDGVDLLMRRTNIFPGILAPKIEISTKVRIDEIVDQQGAVPPRPQNIKPCHCRKPDMDPVRQKQVCHTPMFHRNRCTKAMRSHSNSRSCCNLVQKEEIPAHDCRSPQWNKVCNKTSEENMEKLLLESRFIDEPNQEKEECIERRKHNKMKIGPCTCEICRKYHELFHSRPVVSSS